jgi:hypothetical protein
LGCGFGVKSASAAWRVRDPATIIVATGMLLPVVEQELPRLFATRDIEASVETRA